MRIEELESTFDVFSLGKLLWAMISDTPILQLWYFDQPQFNLAEKFPSNPHMGLANSLFGKCIVEWENECLPNASALLEEVDNTLSAIEGGADPIDLDIERKCKVCGPGFYKLLVDRDFTDVPERSVGLNPPIGKHRLFTCNHCAHVQWFYFRDRILPPAWAE